MQILSDLVDTTDFPARWHCGSWSAAHGWTHVTADVLIFLAYMAIPVMFARLYRQRRSDVPFPQLLLLFSLFVAACGTTHLIEATIFWKPVYRLSATFKVATALVSWATVLALIPALPRMMSMQFPEALERQVQERTRELQERGRELEAERARLEEARSELARANEKLSAQHAAMEEFIFTVSHDLKAPLITTTGFLDVLGEAVADGDGETIDLAMHRVQTATERMQALLEDLLRVGRLQRIDLDPRPVALAPAVQTCLEGLAAVIDEAGASVDLEVSGTVHMDPTWLARALDNLVTNAAKYGRGRIRISSRPVGDAVQIGVEDDGPGIEADLRARVFQMFQRLQRDGSGTGVGLTIVDRIATRHGGRVWVEEGEWGGAAFVLEVPGHA
jgi:signal transduction histidine kinase